MCGIAGFISKRMRAALELKRIASCMADKLVHRGPDDHGVWTSPDVGLAFGFRRLAILDLSPKGHQPMTSQNGRFTIIFNGEVYNYRELRSELETFGHTFQGNSDTEVILASFMQWGIHDAVCRFVGMFAIVVWDRDCRKLSLVRDRLGIKPLYYGWCRDTFLFGSELKALRAHPSFMPEVNREALALQMQLQYVPGPHSIYEGIFKLMPGRIATLSLDTVCPGMPPDLDVYWSIEQTSLRGQESPFRGTQTDALQELESLLSHAIKLRMISDVPLGAFLSGGIDSSMVVAMMQAQSSVPIRTFTIGFNEREMDESHYSRRIAEYLGTAHTELILDQHDALDVIPELPGVYDEPFGDSSQIPTYLVSKLARKNVTVCLSGDGGDELFGGYTRYRRAQEQWQKVGKYPKVLRQSFATVLDSFSSTFRSQRFAEYLRSGSRTAFYKRSITIWSDRGGLVLGTKMGSAVVDTCDAGHGLSFEQEMMNCDFGMYLPDDILVKVDRASMAAGLEARVPLLDHRLVEFSMRLPLRMKIANGQGKLILRKLLYRYVPEQLVERPKAGFGIPLAAWLRGKLRPWAEDLLSREHLDRDGYLNADLVRLAWRSHLAGTEDLSVMLWQVLTFQSWYMHQKGAILSCGL